MKRTTVKEIKQWMKTLEENRYKKTYNSDARRVAWFVNNSLSEDYDTMPESMRKKWVKAEYKKERYMAKKFLESKKQNESHEDKIRQVIKETIRDLMEGKFAELYMKNDMKTKKVVSKIIKQLRLKIDKDYDVKALDSKGKVQKFFILPKHRDKFLELLMKNRIKVRG